MSCEKYREMISAYLDLELIDREKKSLESHLLTCANCRKFMEELHDIKSISESSDQVIIPETLENEILRKTVKSEKKAKTILDSFRGYYRIPRTLVWIGMLAIVFLFGNTVLKPFQPKAEMPIVRIEPVQHKEIIQKIVFSDDDIVSVKTVANPNNEI
jgi:predicted anti-sigma-YlaC factor YlaD